MVLCPNEIVQCAESSKQFHLCRHRILTHPLNYLETVLHHPKYTLNDITSLCVSEVEQFFVILQPVQAVV